MVLVTDGEEAGLMGAAALVTDRDVTRRLHAYINVESIGAAGPPLFEAGPGNGWLVSPWARARIRAAARSASRSTSGCRTTRTSRSSSAGDPGPQFRRRSATATRITPRDTAERLSPKPARYGEQNVVAIVNALDGVDITQRSADRTYFDIGGTVARATDRRCRLAIAVAALMLGVVAWVKVTARRSGWGRRALAADVASGSLVGAALVVASMIGATWALRAAREVYHPWYAPRDDCSCCCSRRRTGRLGRRARRPAAARARARRRHPGVAWSLTLPLWIALAVGGAVVGPGAAYLWTLPLLAAGLLLLAHVPSANDGIVRACRCRARRRRHAVAARHARPARFVGRGVRTVPIVTPVFVYAALMALRA